MQIMSLGYHCVRHSWRDEWEQLFCRGRRCSHQIPRACGCGGGSGLSSSRVIKEDICIIWANVVAIWTPFCTICYFPFVFVLFVIKMTNRLLETLKTFNETLKLSVNVRYNTIERRENGNTIVDQGQFAALKVQYVQFCHLAFRVQISTLTLLCWFIWGFTNKGNVLMVRSENSRFNHSWISSTQCIVILFPSLSFQRIAHLAESTSGVICSFIFWILTDCLSFLKSFPDAQNVWWMLIRCQTTLWFFWCGLVSNIPQIVTFMYNWIWISGFSSQ